MASIIINGKSSDQISVYDRGLQYGDGLFETIALRNNKLLLWQDHLDRLTHGCQLLNLPNVSEQQWLDDIQALNIKSSNGIIKLVLTRGAGRRGYQYTDAAEISRIVSVHPWPDYPESNMTQGIKSIFCKTKVSMNSTLAGVKHLNRLDNVLARNEWQDKSIIEGLMLNDDDQVIEGTMSNIFAVNDHVLYTPLIEKSGVKGVMRENIIKLAHTLDIDVQQTCLSKELLLNMDEIFITNSLIGIWPVIDLQNHSFPLGGISSLLIKNLDMNQGAQVL